MNQSAGAWDVHDQIEQELKRLQKDIDATNSTYQSILKNLLRSYTNAMHQYVQPTVYLQPICPTYVCVPGRPLPTPEEAQEVIIVAEKLQDTLPSSSSESSAACPLAHIDQSSGEKFERFETKTSFPVDLASRFPSLQANIFSTSFPEPLSSRFPSFQANIFPVLEQHTSSFIYNALPKSYANPPSTFKCQLQNRFASLAQEGDNNENETEEEANSEPIVVLESYSTVIKKKPQQKNRTRRKKNIHTFNLLEKDPVVEIEGKSPPQIPVKNDLKFAATIFLVLDYWCTWFRHDLRRCFEMVGAFVETFQFQLIQLFMKLEFTNRSPNAMPMILMIVRFRKALESLQRGAPWMSRFEKEQLDPVVLKTFFSEYDLCYSSLHELYPHILGLLYLDKEGKACEWKMQKAIVQQMSYFQEKLLSFSNVRQSILKNRSQIYEMWVQQYNNIPLEELVTQLQSTKTEDCDPPIYCRCLDPNCMIQQTHLNTGLSTKRETKWTHEEYEIINRCMEKLVSFLVVAAD